jgi:phosphoserine phosphatase RsbU/P
VLVQAGHPHPMILRAGGRLERLGEGGLPIGLIPGAAYENSAFNLSPGDRLFLMSDGITECPGPEGLDLGEDGLAQMLKRLQDLESPALLEALIWDLAEHAGTDRFTDDVSGVLLDYRG